jgi:hypothetical protein
VIAIGKCLLRGPLVPDDGTLLQLIIQPFLTAVLTALGKAAKTMSSDECCSVCVRSVPSHHAKGSGWVCFNCTVALSQTLTVRARSTL